LFVLVKEFVIYSIIVLALMDTLEMNVSLFNVMESIQPIQMFVLERGLVIFSIIALVMQVTQEINANLLNVI
jgi:hypothetical protein